MRFTRLATPPPPSIHRRTRRYPSPRLPHREGLRNMALRPVLSSIVGWLRAGYPEGVPNVDYMPLFALLASQLSDADVAAIAGELAAASDVGSAQAIRDAIETITHEKPLESDVNRVSARLAAGGWPPARPRHPPRAGPRSVARAPVDQRLDDDAVSVDADSVQAQAAVQGEHQVARAGRQRRRGRR